MFVQSERDKIIWKNIEAILKERRMTQKRLADLAKTNPQAIRNIKFGLKGIGSGLLKRFAIALGVSIEQLLSGTEKPVNNFFSKSTLPTGMGKSAS